MSRENSPKSPSRNVANLPIRKQKKPDNWFQKGGILRQFWWTRRQDLRFDIVPIKFLTLAIILVATLVLFLMHFVDDNYLDALRTNAFERREIYKLLTRVGEANWILLLSIALLVFMSFASAEKYTGKLTAVWIRAYFFVSFVFTSVAVSGLLVMLLKVCFGRARPEAVTGGSAIDFNFWTFGYQFASFPSGHSATAGSLTVALALLFPTLRWPILIFGFGIALTRPLVGAHFPSDIVAGFALGALISWFFARWSARYRVLFAFDDHGKLKVRREGIGYIHNIPSMLWQAFGGAKAQAKRRKK